MIVGGAETFVEDIAADILFFLFAYNRSVPEPVHSWSRRAAAAVVLLAAVVALCRLLPQINPMTVSLALLLTVLAVSASWGLRISVLLSILATLALNYFFLPPVGTLTIADPQNWVALFAFLTTAIVASQLSERARREARAAHRRQAEAERLYAFSQHLLGSGNVSALLNSIPRFLVDTFGFTSAALYLASREELYRAGGAVSDLSGEMLRTVMARGEGSSLEPGSDTVYLPVCLGVRPVGSLGLKGNLPSRETRDALGSLVAISIERANAVDALSRTEAVRQSEQLRSALLDSVTHELRTPLTAIKASVTSLLDSAPRLSESERNDLLCVIDEEADRLNHLVEEANEMARLDAGEVELRRRTVNTGDVIQAAVEACRLVLAEHPVSIDAPASLPAIHIDPERMREALIHLLKNAAKYSPSGMPIHVAAEADARDLTISVADRGIGIDSAEQAMIFDKFYRGQAHRERIPGTGMGLSITRALVEAHGGSMNVVSQLGHGSVFQIRLPLYSEGRS